MVVLEFMFYKVYHFYNKRWPGKDAEIYATCFVAIWFYFLFLFLLMMLSNLTRIHPLTDKDRWLIIIPGIFFLAGGWGLWLNSNQYKRIVNNKKLNELGSTTKGKLYITILLLLPCLILIIALITKPTS